MILRQSVKPSGPAGPTVVTLYDGLLYVLLELFILENSPGPSLCIEPPILPPGP